MQKTNKDTNEIYNDAFGKRVALFTSLAGGGFINSDNPEVRKNEYMLRLAINNASNEHGINFDPAKIELKKSYIIKASIATIFGGNINFDNKTKRKSIFLNIPILRKVYEIKEQKIAETKQQKLNSVVGFFVMENNNKGIRSNINCLSR